MFELFLSSLIQGHNDFVIMQALQQEERNKKADQALARINKREAQVKADRRVAQIARETAACEARQRVEKGFQLREQRERSSKIEANLYREAASQRGPRFEMLERQSRRTHNARRLKQLFGEEE